MNTQLIQRQYDEIIAPHYDLDPQAVTGCALDQALDQIKRHLPLGDSPTRLSVFDVGVGTGLFMAKLKAQGGDQIRPFGLDFSEKMVEKARGKIPDLDAAVDDAANLDAHFPSESFDLICTHFITGFVPMRVLAPKIWSRLRVGGYWSFVGGSMAAFPALQAKANSKFIRFLCGGKEVAIDNLVHNPRDREEVVNTLEAHKLTVCQVETYRPTLDFKNFDGFMDFAYRGGWLTPFIEKLGLHQASALTRLALNSLLFPVTDHHSIEIVLAQKLSD